MNLSNDNLHASFWSLKVKTLLDELRFSYLFNYDNIINAQIKMLIEQVYDQYLQEWCRELNDIDLELAIDPLPLGGVFYNIIF